MATKLQFNPSSLKVLFNPATQKVQMAVAPAMLNWESLCYDCPSNIVITLSDILLCLNCFYSGYPGLYLKYGFNVNLNQSWVLPIMSTTPGSCAWYRKLSNVLSIITYDNSDCGGEGSSGIYHNVTIIVVCSDGKGGIGINETVEIGQWGLHGILFQATDLIGQCVNIPNEHQNEDCGVGSPPIIGYGGVATINL